MRNGGQGMNWIPLMKRKDVTVTGDERTAGEGVKENELTEVHRWGARSPGLWQAVDKGVGVSPSAVGSLWTVSVGE